MEKAIKVAECLRKRIDEQAQQILDLEKQLQKQSHPAASSPSPSTELLKLKHSKAENNKRSHSPSESEASPAAADVIQKGEGATSSGASSSSSGGSEKRQCSDSDSKFEYSVAFVQRVVREMGLVPQIGKGSGSEAEAQRVKDELDYVEREKKDDLITPVVNATPAADVVQGMVVVQTPSEAAIEANMTVHKSVLVKQLPRQFREAADDFLDELFNLTSFDISNSGNISLDGNHINANLLKLVKLMYTGKRKPKGSDIFYSFIVKNGLQRFIENPFLIGIYLSQKPGDNKKGLIASSSPVTSASASAPPSAENWFGLNWWRFWTNLPDFAS